MKVYVIIFIIILFALLLLFGFYRFQNAVSKEKNTLFRQYSKNQNIISNNDLNGLPELLKQHLQKVGVIGKHKDGHISFKEEGKIKTSQEKGWTNFRAVQYMTAETPNFIWSALAYPVFIRDKSINGKGEVLVNLFGLKDVARSIGRETDESALARCLGELLFYPVGFLSDAISWEAIDDKSVKAKVKINNVRAEGIFYFNEAGLLSRFQAKRYMDETLENFTGIAEDFKIMDGLLVPTKMKAIWNLKDGDFEYFNCTISNYIMESTND